MDTFPVGNLALEEEGWCFMKKNRRKGYKLILILMFLTCSLFLGGCWGKREVEDLAPLLGIGFDQGKTPGTYLITEQFARPKKQGQSGTDIEDRTFTVEASSLRDAYEKFSVATYRTPFMGSLKVIVIGEDLARAGGFNDILDFSQRFAEFRRSMYLVLAKGKAQDIFELKLRSGLLPALAIKSNIEGGDELSIFPTVRLGHYLTILGTKSIAPILPVIQIVKPGEGIEYKPDKGNEPGEMKIREAGVLRGDRLVDYLTDEESKGYMWLNNDVKQRSINTVDIAENTINFGGQVLRSSTKFRITDNNGEIGLNYQIKASIAIDEILGLKKSLSGAEWVVLTKQAEETFAKVIEKECQSALKKQRELSLDFLGIGRHIEQKKSAYWKTIKDQWETEIADFPVSVDIKVTIEHTGMSSSSAINSGKEGQE